MLCISKYWQEHYNKSACSFLSNVQGTFFNATHQVKEIAIGVVKANPLVEISWLLWWCVHLHVFFPKKPQNRYTELAPNTQFYIALYTIFCNFIGITFTRPVFLFKISGDVGKNTCRCTHHNNQLISTRGLASETPIAIAFTWCVALKKVPGTF